MAYENTCASDADEAVVKKKEKLMRTHVGTLLGHICRTNAGDVSAAVSKLPKIFSSEAFQKKFLALTTTVKECKFSGDKSTIKFVLELQDGKKVESTVMLHGSRATLCVSSQVGCMMGCTFCAIGTMGFQGNLTSGEILEQVIHANRALSVLPVKTASKCPDKSSTMPLYGPMITIEEGDDVEIDARERRIPVVVLWEWENPMNNFDEVMKTIRFHDQPWRFGLGMSKISLSTVGVLPYMKRLTSRSSRCDLRYLCTRPIRFCARKLFQAQVATQSKSSFSPSTSTPLGASSRLCSSTFC